MSLLLIDSEDDVLVGRFEGVVNVVFGKIYDGDWKKIRVQLTGVGMRTLILPRLLLIVLIDNAVVVGCSVAGSCCCWMIRTTTSLLKGGIQMGIGRIWTSMQDGDWKEEIQMGIGWIRASMLDGDWKGSISTISLLIVPIDDVVVVVDCSNRCCCC